jgi:hypothetical protein
MYMAEYLDTYKNMQIFQILDISRNVIPILETIADWLLFKPISE